MAQRTDNPIIVMETSMGTITAELWADKAPETVENFLQYVDEGFFNGTIFHRIIDGFMIQGGGFTVDMQQKPTHDEITNEAAPELRNQRGTLAMARTHEVHSATSQFFINLVDNAFLNQTNGTAEGFGYCVFGKVTGGMDVVDAIGKVKTASRGYHDDVPVKPVEIKKVKRQ